jgi:UDP-N-acetyl-D-galactosamine dehydrogenase
VILSGRRVNDHMGVFVANKLVKLLIKKGHRIEGSRVLILGITFKENCPDIRNTRVVDVYRELTDFGMRVDVYDPWASGREVSEEYGIKLSPQILGPYEAVILAVAHAEFKELDFSEFTRNDSVVFDLKATLPKASVDARL